MKRPATALLTLLAFASATTLGASQKPDFSGSWISVSPPEATGQEQVVRQTETTLSTGHPSSNGGHQDVYKLDGSESRNELTSHGEAIVSLSKAVWEGSKLVITTATTYPDGRKADSKSIWSLDPTGRLVIEHTRTITSGPEFAITLVYKKK